MSELRFSLYDSKAMVPYRRDSQSSLEFLPHISSISLAMLSTKLAEELVGSLCVMWDNVAPCEGAENHAGTECK